MTEVEALDLVTNTVREVLDNDDIVLAPESTADATPGWDSLAHVKIIITLERKIGRRFSAREIEALRSVGDLVQAVAAGK